VKVNCAQTVSEFYFLQDIAMSTSYQRKS